MKKRIICLLIILLMTTGCTCEYNLTIDDNIYSEKIIVTATTSSEKNDLSTKWIIASDKDNYNIIQEEPSEVDGWSYYNYETIGNDGVFQQDFSQSEIINSTATSICYDTVSVSDYNNNIVISTSKKNNCFKKYPTLSKLRINIKTSKKVKNHNADYAGENIYSWIITKENVNNKSVNMVIEDIESDSKSQSSSSIPSASQSKINKTKNQTMYYVFTAILLVIMLVIYFIFKKVQNKNKMDE